MDRNERNLQELKILIIEDNPGDSGLLKEYLHGHKGDYHVQCVEAETFLNQGLRILGEGCYDAVLLDLSLPGSSGIGTFVKVLEIAQNVPILLLSSLSDEKIAREMISLGAQDYLIKGTLDAEAMLRSIRYAIERSELKQQLKRGKKIWFILEAIPEAILIVSREEEIVYANSAAERLLASEGKDLRGEKWGLSATMGSPTEFQVTSREGDVQHLELRSVSVDWDNENAQLVSLRDVTERKRMEAEHARFTQLESLGILAGGIAHDFNNVLTGIMGNVTMAQMLADPGSKLQEYLQKAEKSCRVAGGLVQKLMPLAQGGESVKGLVPMKVFMTETLQDLEVPPSITMDVSLQDNLWDAEIDVQQVKNALLALVKNAIQAIPEEGSVGIYAKNVWIDKEGPADLSAGPYLSVKISDSGTGIGEENLTRIFEPYFTTRDGSDGLGLAVAYSVLKRHRGRILVHAGQEGGTIFELLIPAMGATEMTGESDSVTPPAVDGKGEESPDKAVGIPEFEPPQWRKIVRP